MAGAGVVVDPAVVPESVDAPVLRPLEPPPPSVAVVSAPELEPPLVVSEAPVSGATSVDDSLEVELVPALDVELVATGGMALPVVGTVSVGAPAVLSELAEPPQAASTNAARTAHATAANR